MRVARFTPLRRNRLVLAAATALLTAGSLTGAGAAAATTAPDCGAVPGNLVANCGFETGDFTSWTLTDADGGYTNVDTVPHTGTYSANFANANGQDANLSQVLQTAPGTTYTLSFWIRSYLDAGHLTDYIDGTQHGTRAFDDSEQRGGEDIYKWTHVKHRFTSDSTGTVTLTFHGRNQDGYTLIDDVSVAPAA